MAKYEMKYMFDWGSGTCLWSENDEAIRDYDYAVDINAIPISSELKDYLFLLIDQHDEALNWDDPASELLWNQEEQDAFIEKATKAYKRLCEEMGNQYAIQLSELI